MSSRERQQLLAEDSSKESSDDSSAINGLADPADTAELLQWDIDEAVREVGFGRYQFILWFFLQLVAMSCGFNNMAMVFEGGRSGQQCLTPPNSTSAHNGTTTTYIAGECKYTENVTHTFEETNSTSYSREMECDSWVYDRHVYNSTIITEWDLTCDKSYLVGLTSTVYMLGFFSGCLVLGDLADRYGRRMLLLLSAFLTLAAGIGAAFSPDYIVFTVLRFFVGVGVAGTRNSAYILAAEMARAQDRATLGLISDTFYSTAYILTGFVFYLDPNWRHFQFYISIYHIFYLSYALFMPESPRWLFTQGRNRQAMDYFKTSARINRKKMPHNVTITLKQQPHKRHSTIDLVRTANLRKVGLVLLFLWFLVSFVYFGMSYNVSNIQGSIYVNNALLGAVELAANFVCIWAVRFGRRPAIFSMFVIAATAMLAIVFAQSSYWAVIILALIGKFVTAPCFSYIYIATIELYPTQTRTLALGAGSSVARLGGAVAPVIPPTYSYWDKLPYIIFSASSLIGSFAALFLPETKDRPLPDSIESAEEVNIVKFHFPVTCKNSALQVEPGDDNVTA